MPYPNDRRKHQAEGDEVLSREYLAMLTARSREFYPGARNAERSSQAPKAYGRRKDDLPQPPPHRRRGDETPTGE